MHSFLKRPFTHFVGAFFLFLLACTCIFAADEPSPVDTPTTTQHEPHPFDLEADKVVDDETTHFFNEFIKMLGTLGLLIAIMIFSSWVLKGMLNKQKQRMTSSDSIKVLERCQLSHNGSLYLIEVDNKTLLVGESAQNITLLTDLSETENKT